MRLSLVSGVHACAVGEDLVFLDVPGDRYHCLPAGHGVSLAPGIAALDVPDAALADELTTAGLVAPGLPPRAARPIVPPRRDLPEVPCAALRAADAWAIAEASFDLLRAYAGRPLADLLATAAEAPRPRRAPRGSLEACALGFRRWAPFAPTSAKCLLRAFMLLRVLRRAGHDAAWVFGVTTRPFSAHCWVQAGDQVLDDHWERLLRYQPILAV